MDKIRLKKEEIEKVLHECFDITYRYKKGKSIPIIEESIKSTLMNIESKGYIEKSKLEIMKHNYDCRTTDDEDSNNYIEELEKENRRFRKNIENRKKG